MARHIGAILAQGKCGTMDFVPKCTFWQFLTRDDTSQLSQSCVVASGRRTFDLFQVLLLGRGIDEVEEIYTPRLYLRVSRSGALKALDDTSSVSS
eukprot:8659992-Karenia_brevis.AAC.1